MVDGTAGKIMQRIKSRKNWKKVLTAGKSSDNIIERLRERHPRETNCRASEKGLKKT
jgi:hypothetical protein